MIPVIEIQTKYKYGDKVIVKHGFYRGKVGIVTSYCPREFISEKTMFSSKKMEIIEYHLKLVNDNLDILVTEKQIEIAGVK